ncbi:hypothetical protein FKM82_022448 [Ascaphus truei]
MSKEVLGIIVLFPTVQDLSWYSRHVSSDRFQGWFRHSIYCRGSDCTGYPRGDKVFYKHLASFEPVASKTTSLHIYVGIET